MVWLRPCHPLGRPSSSAPPKKRNHVIPYWANGPTCLGRNEASERIANIQPGDVIFISSKQLSCIDDSEVFLFGGSVTVQSPPHATGKGGSFAQASRSG